MPEGAESFGTGHNIGNLPAISIYSAFLIRERVAYAGAGALPGWKFSADYTPSLVDCMGAGASPPAFRVEIFQSHFTAELPTNALLHHHDHSHLIFTYRGT